MLKICSLIKDGGKHCDNMKEREKNCININVKDDRNISIGKAKQTQMELAGKVKYYGPLKSIADVSIIAGVDVNDMQNGKAFVAVALLSFPDMRVIKKIYFSKKYRNLMPDIPAYSAFRQMPSIGDAFKKLTVKPDVIIFDGHGTAHPRRLGLASHAGVVLGIPSIGCAQSHLFGAYEEPPRALNGAYNVVRDESGDIIGIALRTKMNTKLIFVSVGNLLDLELAGDIVMTCCKKNKIPEPLRVAHRLAQIERKR